MKHMIDDLVGMKFARLSYLRMYASEKRRWVGDFVFETRLLDALHSYASHNYKQATVWVEKYIPLTF